MIFIDLEKAYDKVLRNIMWWALKRKLVPTKYVILIKDMYTNVMTYVRACKGESDTFSIKIGLHQGSVLSPYIFTLVMDEITNDIQGDIPWCMLFANDMVLIDESGIEVNQKLEL
jgi:Reverse transcriptase (RNA-dependent DNA polymerase)